MPRCWPTTLVQGGLAITTGGTDNHLMLVDLRPKKLTGKDSEHSLEAGRHHLQQERHPVRSGEADDHLGHPSRHAGGDHAAASGRRSSRQVGQMIVRVLDGLAANRADNSRIEQEVREEVRALCKRFPIYGG